MAKMGVAFSASDFGSLHPKFIVCFLGDSRRADRLEKTWPTGAAFEFAVHIIKRRSATDAVENPIVFWEIIVAPRALCAAFLGHFICEV